MTGWYAEVQFHGELRRDQLKEVAQGAGLAHYREGDNVLRLRRALDAVEYDDAVREGLAWVAGLHVTTELVPAGVMSGPEGFLIETHAARARDWDLVGAAEIAARLGVSTARVRQLEQRDDWPTPALTLAGGRIYRAADIDEFARGWSRRPGRPGKTSTE